MIIPVWSYSFLSTYDRCPRQGQARYITKELPYEETPEAKHGNNVHKAAEDALRLKQFPIVPYDNLVPYFRDIYSIPAKKIFSEQMLGVDKDWQPVDFFAENVWGRGKLDVTALISDEAALLFDWKTGKVWEDPLELEIQAILLQAKYPNLKTIRGCYIWLKDDKYGEVYDLSSSIEKTKTWILTVMCRVGQGIFYANKNPLCGWCTLRNCKYWKERGK